MGVVTALRSAWRKNEPELQGFFNGALPEFVTAARPRASLHGIPVFCYHLVEPDEFEADLAYLARNGYRTLRGQELVEHLRGERPLPERSVLLTFDDGPLNFFQVAFPLLQRYGARATAFIAPRLHVDAAAEQVAEARPMTWDEIVAIHASGLVEFQSHTLESRFIPEWPRPAALSGVRWSIEAPRRGTALSLREDLERSRHMIESRLPGLRVNQLAFPMYLGTPDAIEDARAVGLEACYWGLRPGRALNAPGASPYHMSRMSDEFLRRLPGEGRISVRELLRLRLRRIQAARAWRRHFPE